MASVLESLAVGIALTLGTVLGLLLWAATV
jgi:hypothetical protein